MESEWKQARDWVADFLGWATLSLCAMLMLSWVNREMVPAAAANEPIPGHWSMRSDAEESDSLKWRYVETLRDSTGRAYLITIDAQVPEFPSNLKIAGRDSAGGGR